jgi:hypothetical protein
MPYAPRKFLSDTCIDALVKECASIHHADSKEEKMAIVAKCLQSPLLDGISYWRIAKAIHSAYSKRLQSRPICTAGRPRKGRDAFIAPITIDSNANPDSLLVSTQLQEIGVARQAHEREQDRLEKQRTLARERRLRCHATQDSTTGEPSQPTTSNTSVPLGPIIPQDIYCEKTAPAELRRLLPPRSRGRPTASDTASRRMIMKDYWFTRGYT